MNLVINNRYRKMFMIREGSGLILRYDLASMTIDQWLRMPNTIITAISTNDMGHDLYVSTYGAVYRVDLLTEARILMTGHGIGSVMSSPGLCFSLIVLFDRQQY